MIGQRQKTFVPAAGFNWLTRIYDPVMSLLMRERVWRTRLVAQVAPKPSERILDLGCGAGVPVDDILIKAGHEVIGIDNAVKQIELARKL